MTPDEFRALMTRIAQNADNQGLVTELSTQAIDAFQSTAGNVEALTQRVGDYENQVTNLKEKNMELFLKVAQPVTNQEALQKAEPLKYEDLIKEF